jgi:hypothetical protein
MFFFPVVKSPIQTGTLSVKYASEKLSHLGTFTVKVSHLWYFNAVYPDVKVAQTESWECDFKVPDIPTPTFGLRAAVLGQSLQINIKENPSSPSKVQCDLTDLIVFYSSKLP